ncbi:hypothetical protein HPB51_000543 [Rhipicephalus microplus]|uniref:THAP-type domain-containing protein n=1 Tax=Rhipicephalus microplus TaxID=6941 RepID=A0A9J6EPW2_RHIMP|nr:hypothetical protein HPB51_000543 [Rhipicephalus microplus]
MSMSETTHDHRKSTDEPQGCSDVTQRTTSSEWAQVDGLMSQEPWIRPVDAGERSASSRGIKPKVEKVIGNVVEPMAERQLPGAKETAGRSAEDSSGGTADKKARREFEKKEKPLSKRMALARLIAPSRRSTRTAVVGTSSGRPEVKKAPPNEAEVLGRRAADKNLESYFIPRRTKPAHVFWWSEAGDEEEDKKSACRFIVMMISVREFRGFSASLKQGPFLGHMVKGPGSLYKCCVSGCRASGREPFTGIWLFSLPADEALESSWREKLPIDPEISRPRSPRVCFQHFRDKDFVVFKGRPRGVAEEAVPTLVRNEQSLRH